MAHTNGEANLTLEVKRSSQHRTINLAILVDLLSPMNCAKIRTQGLFDYGEEDFLRVLPYMGMTAILINGPYPFKQSFTLLPTEAPHEI